MQNMDVLDSDLQRLLDDFQALKEVFVNSEGDRRILKRQITHLQNDLENSRELEISHRNNLSATRKLTVELHSQIAKLACLRGENKDCLEKVALAEKTMKTIEQEKISLLERHREEVFEVKKAHQDDIEKIIKQCELKVQQSKNEQEIASAQSACVVGELNDQLATLRKDSEEKGNIIVLEYEEKLQRAHVQATQFRDEHHALLTNIAIYRKKVEELEQKLHTYEIRQSNPSIYSRPNPVSQAPNSSVKNTKSAYGSLQIIQNDSSSASVPKNTFNANKKRKLFVNKENF